MDGDVSLLFSHRKWSIVAPFSTTNYIFLLYLNEHAVLLFFIESSLCRVVSGGLGLIIQHCGATWCGCCCSGTHNIYLPKHMLFALHNLCRLPKTGHIIPAITPMALLRRPYIAILYLFTLVFGLNWIFSYILFVKFIWSFATFFFLFPFCRLYLLSSGRAGFSKYFVYPNNPFETLSNFVLIPLNRFHPECNFFLARAIDKNNKNSIFLSERL